MKKERSSNFELLRLLCIFGILVMHTFAGIDTTVSTQNLLLQVFCNSLFNTGVTCFVLISGYFGIRFDLAKLVRLDLMIIFFTLAGNLLLGDFGIKTLIKSCIPVISRQYWFISCYFVLCILAPYLNQIPEKMKKEQFRTLLLVFLLIFSVIPTVTTYDIMQDAGKGLADFVMIYLIGRYLALYCSGPLRIRRLLAGIVLSVGIIFAADGARSLASGVIYTTFARDCSVFIISASVLLLLLFQELRFKNGVINRAAGNVLAVYVLDGFLRAFLNRYIDWELYAGKWYLIFLVFAYVLAVMLAAILANELRKFTIGRVEPWLSERIVRLWNRLRTWLLRFADKALAFFS